MLKKSLTILIVGILIFTGCTGSTAYQNESSEQLNVQELTIYIDRQALLAGQSTVIRYTGSMATDLQKPTAQSEYGTLSSMENGSASRFLNRENL